MFLHLYLSVNVPSLIDEGKNRSAKMAIYIIALNYQHIQLRNVKHYLRSIYCYCMNNEIITNESCEGVFIKQNEDFYILNNHSNNMMC